MALPTPGIVAWTTSIRTSMAKDSCRQLFEDQVQTHGFIFLDDYLENILAGPKQEPIIEFVKTPARKKAAPKRTRAATSAAAKAQNSILLSLEEEDISKENQPPVNSFHKALLHAKQTAESMGSHADSDCTEPISPQPKPAGTTVGEHVRHVLDLVEDDSAPEVENTTVSLDTFHSIPLDSPKPTRAQKTHTGNHTQPLPQISSASPTIAHARDALTAPLPLLPASSFAPALTTMAVPLNDSPSRILAHKSSASQFPTLRAPSPLRKSMRVAIEPSTGAGILAPAVAAPTQPPALGKRTSWLMKAREVKAMENIVHSKTSILGPGVGTMNPPGNTVAPLKRKSGDMLAAAPLTSDKTDEGRRAKVAKASEFDSAPQNSKDPPALNQETAMLTQAPPFALAPTRAVHLPEEHWEPLNDKEDEASFIGVFKRTVEGLGARAGRSMGKSLGGGAAAAALAEARAAAEARVAERNKITEEELTESEDSSAPCAEELQPAAEDVHSRKSERKLSLSDIVSTNENPLAIQSSSAADESISTTPPNSPPPTRTSGSSFVPPPGPVFNRQPPQVFMPPISKQIAPLAKEFSFNLPITTFTLPPPISLGLPARLTSPPSSSRPPPQASSTQQSSQASTLSDAVFDRVEDVPAWMPSSQDTEYTDGTESQIHRAKFATLEDDDDDSWPLEEKLAASEQGWTPFNFNNKEDSMTWSTLPTESQGPTRTKGDLTGNSAKNAVQQDAIPGAFAMDIDSDVVKVQDNGVDTLEPETDHESVMYTSDLSDVIKAGQSTVTLIEPKSGDIPRSESQLSMASTSSSSQQSQIGFFGQATKLVNSMLGTGKKVKPEVKSLQLAAAAAKKQEEEAHKKAVRLKEMEARRQAALARKADEERSRAAEEKKIKEESEKRKRERDETTEKRPLKTTAVPKKVEDDATKKRKITVDDKKLEVKKPPSKDKKDAPPPKLAKSSLATPATKIASASKNLKVPASSALVSSATYNASQNVAGSSAVKPAATEVKSSKVGPPKGKAKAVPQENEDKLPSAVVQNQMAARAMAQLRAAKQQPPEIASESIELPDINSEYSDSEDEDRVRTFDPPDWAQSPELRQALQMQSTVDPDDIFGAIRPLRMEELFRTRQSRFRARTSSANWSGSDRLTVEEEREYARRMGFTKHVS